MDGWPDSGNTWSRALMREEGVASRPVRWVVGRVHAEDAPPPGDTVPPGVALAGDLSVTSCWTARSTR